MKVVVSSGCTVQNALVICGFAVRDLDNSRTRKTAEYNENVRHKVVVWSRYDFTVLFFVVDSKLL